MRHLIILLFFSFSLTSFGSLRSVKITASGGSPIPNSYDIGDTQSATVQCQGGARHLIVQNETDERLRVIPVKITQSPSDSSPDQLYVRAQGNWAGDFLPIQAGATVFLASDGAAITSGVVTIQCW